MTAIQRAILLVLLLTLAACAPWQPPVGGQRPSSPAPSAQREAAPAPPIYQVRSGETLYSISFRYGLDWREVAAWNRIEAPYTIRPGQELRLSEPPRRVVAEAPRPTPTPQSTPQSTPQRSESPPTSSSPASVEDDASRAAPPAGNVATRSVGGVTWRWPTEGTVARPFDPAATRRGIGVAGRVGQSVVAAADGEVVYSGTALIGYGELIIVKHSDNMLSAYGHNRRRLVEEGARVRAGQAIAEMGLNERDEDILHFEIRRNGQPEDPMRYLPPR